MSCETQTKKINDIDFTCTQYPAKIGAKYKLKLVEIFNAPIVEIIPMFTGKKKKPNEAEQVTMMTNAIKGLFSSASPDEVIDLIWEMLSTGSVRREGEILNEAKIDQYFSGDDLLSVYKVFIFVLRVNYSGLLKGQKAAEILTKVEEAL